MTHTATHTPGPWKAVRDETRNAYAWNVEGAPGIVPVIARLALIDAGAQIEPNAHLIAAAPAMYEALQAMIVEWDKHGCCDSRDVVYRAQQALAQADGKQ